MQNHRPIRVLMFAASVAALGIAGGGAAAAQDDGSTTSTTQLDIGGEESTTTTAPPESTTTTQLDVGGESTTTTAPPEVLSGSTSGQAPAQPPSRVDAGAGGTASSSGVPLSTAALAGGLAIVVGAAAVRTRRELRA